MFVGVFGFIIIYAAVAQMGVVEPEPANAIYYNHPTEMSEVYEKVEGVKPLADFRFRNVVKQAYDYSCGSAALTTVLNHYLGRQFEERQIMEGLLRYGETEKIVERRGFSMLDMKRLVSALGHPSGGFKAEFEDIKTLDHPAIVPIQYAGFKHFVVLRAYKDGHVFVADPAIGNVSFTEQRFQEIWEKKVLFIVFPNGFKPQTDLELVDSDMRIVDDRVISQLVFKEFPQFTIPLERAADRTSTLVPVRTEDPVTGESIIINVPTRTYLKN